MTVLRAAGIALLMAASVLAVSIAPPAAAQEGHCDLDPVTLQCRAVAPAPTPGTPGGGGTDGSGGGGGSGGGREIPMTPGAVGGGTQADCTWETVTGAQADQYRGMLANAPSGGDVQICDSGVGEPEVRIVPQGVVPDPPSPREVATTMLAEAQATMRAPQVVADPPVGTPSIITLPVFVQVTNWVDGFEVGPNCVQGVCVTLTAEPTLTFDPGEPGSEPIVCDPPGTRFDPNGPDPAVQASAPGACAYAYQARTGADGRPERWPASVTVTWNVAWQAGDVGDQFQPQALTTEIPREVDEVQTVVRDGGS